MVGTPFTLNCTPSAVNPPVDTVSIGVGWSCVTTSDAVTLTDNVLTTPSVQSHAQCQLLLHLNLHNLPHPQAWEWVYVCVLV